MKNAISFKLKLNEKQELEKKGQMNGWRRPSYGSQTLEEFFKCCSPSSIQNPRTKRTIKTPFQRSRCLFFLPEACTLLKILAFFLFVQSLEHTSIFLPFGALQCFKTWVNSFCEKYLYLFGELQCSSRKNVEDLKSILLFW